MANVIKSIKLGATSTPVIDVTSIDFTGQAAEVEVNLKKNDGSSTPLVFPNAGYDTSGAITGETQTIYGNKVFRGVPPGASYTADLYDDSPQVVISNIVKRFGDETTPIYATTTNVKSFIWQYKSNRISAVGNTSTSSYVIANTLSYTGYYVTSSRNPFSTTSNIKATGAGSNNGYYGYELSKTFAPSGGNSITDGSVIISQALNRRHYGQHDLDNFTYPIIWIWGNPDTFRSLSGTNLSNYVYNNGYVYERAYTNGPINSLVPIKTFDFGERNASGITYSSMAVIPYGVTGGVSTAGYTYISSSTTNTVLKGYNDNSELVLGAYKIRNYVTYEDDGFIDLDNNYLTIVPQEAGCIEIFFENNGQVSLGSSRLYFSAGDSSSDLKMCLDEDNGELSLIPTTNDCGQVGFSDHRFWKMYSSYMYAANGFFETSDERLKNVIKPLDTDLEKLKDIRKVYFEWKDKSSKTEGTQIGILAQDIQKIYPEIVDTNDDNLSVSYEKLSVIALDAIDKLYEKHKELQADHEELEKRVERLEKLLN